MVTIIMVIRKEIVNPQPPTIIITVYQIGQPKKKRKVLPWPVSWLESPPLNQEVVSLIAGHSTWLGCRFGVAGARMGGY